MFDLRLAVVKMETVYIVISLSLALTHNIRTGLAILHSHSSYINTNTIHVDKNVLSIQT